MEKERKESSREKKKEERKKWSGRKGQCAELNRQASEKWSCQWLVSLSLLGTTAFIVSTFLFTPFSSVKSGCYHFPTTQHSD